MVDIVRTAILNVNQDLVITRGGRGELDELELIAGGVDAHGVLQ